jgi:hypothetical protein
MNRAKATGTGRRDQHACVSAGKPERLVRRKGVDRYHPTDQEDTMQVHVEFIGLCLLVPQRDGKQVHLLMPRAGHGASGGHTHQGTHHVHGAAVPRHHTVLSFDAAHLTEYAAASGVPASASLDGEVLRLGQAGGQPDASEALTLVNVSKLSGRAVRATALSGAPSASNHLSCRVTLQSGAAGDPRGGVRWTFPGESEPRLLPHILDWTFTAPDEPLDLGIKVEDGTLPPLHAIGGKIKLRIMHAIADDHLPKPPSVPAPGPGTPAHHFGHLYDLLEPPTVGQTGPLPEYHDSRVGPIPTRGPDKGGSPFNCMLAQGDPPP